MHKPILLITAIFFSLISCSVEKENKKAALFPKGQRLNSENFTGTVWFTPLMDADSVNQNSVGNVTFEPGARTNWHLHPAGQILIATGGEGYYQEKGTQKRILKKGDVVKCPPNVPHWHGASAKKPFYQIAITGREKGPTVWLDKVTDEAYNG